MPRQVQFSFSAGRTVNGASFTSVGGTHLDAAEIGAVWWRRPRPYVMDQALSPPFTAYATAQVHAALSGVWGSLPRQLDERSLARRTGRPQADAAGGGRGAPGWWCRPRSSPASRTTRAPSSRSSAIAR